MRLNCTADTFRPADTTSRVRWLDQDADYPLAEAHWAEADLTLTRHQRDDSRR